VMLYDRTSTVATGRLSLTGLSACAVSFTGKYVSIFLTHLEFTPLVLRVI
jgi:hypothetical protein